MTGILVETRMPGLWLMNRQAATGGFGAVAAVVIVCSVLATAVAVITTTVARHRGERLPFTSVIGRVAPLEPASRWRR
jgi:hypothetical protein